MSFAVIGEALIDLIADEQGNYHPHLGGSPYSVAIGLARLGCSVSYLPPLSDDEFGQRLSTFLAKRGGQHPTAKALAVTYLYRLGQQGRSVTAQLPTLPTGRRGQGYYLGGNHRQPARRLAATAYGLASADP
jgi:hypothetical protein